MLSTGKLPSGLEIPPTAVGGSFKCFLPENYPATLEIPPTAVGGSFKCFLPANYPATLKSHQRQLVDRSNAFYPQTTQRPLNPTNGSWWIVQMLSKRGFEISTHCRGWNLGLLCKARERRTLFFRMFDVRYRL